MIIFAVLSGFGLAFLAPAICRLAKEKSGWWLAILPFALTLYFFSLLPSLAKGEVQSLIFTWSEELGLTLSFRADGLSLAFALLISGIGTLVAVYAGGYFGAKAPIGRFYLWLFFFMASMLGVVFVDNLLLLFIFWELTSLSSFMLIGFEHDRDEARAAAIQALLVTGSGGLVMLAGFVLLGQIGGSWELSSLLPRGESVRANPLYVAILGLILIGAFTKSAQFPFHFWLPNAMQAPTPVSTYLHAATMVKAGVYLLARLYPVLGGNPIWLWAVGGVGAVTMVLGGYLALSQTDMKRLLAYSTISALGSLVMAIGIGSETALKAMVLFLLAHGLYKGTLFLVTGSVDHESGTRDVRYLGGLRRAMPYTAAGSTLAALSMAGVPLFFGFVAKEYLYEAAYKVGALWITLAVLGALLNILIALRVGIAPFWLPEPEGVKLPKKPHEAPWSMTIGPLVLGGLSLLLGTFPQILSSALVSPALSAAAGKMIEVKLAAWHGVNDIFLLSLLTLGLGVGLFAMRNDIQRIAEKLMLPWGLDTLYQRSLDGLFGVATFQTRLLQHGYLRYYLITIVIAVVGITAGGLFRWGGGSLPHLSLDLRFYELGIAIIIVLAGGMAVLSRSRLGAVAALGVAGYGVASIYLLFGAPDLAMTQFLIESLTVVLFVLAFYHLPNFAQLTPRRERMRDVVIALITGSLMTTFVFVASGIQIHPSISQFFVENSLPLAHGRNIVNVILVDFRGLDTLGEITVLGIAGLGVFALLKLRLEQRSTKGGKPAKVSEEGEEK
ncbi:MAG: putative monovalent cation/H+ antiporter subunit A [Anaerolineales bacterium]|nr:putative monovalent cation/H+ antiporter subunit A [Anaerolineales bacterium]